MSLSQLESLKEAIAEGRWSLIDVRERHEYAEGHISLAVNLPLSEVARWSEGIVPDRPIVLYCRTSNRSRRCAELLSARGTREVYVLEGGYRAWSASRPQDD